MSKLDKEYDLPIKYDLFFYKGDSYVRGIRLKDEATNTYFDLTNTLPVAQARETMYSENIMFTFDTGLADQEDPNLVGLIYMQVPESIWPSLPTFDEPTQIGVYDLEVFFPSAPTGKKVTYIYGDLYIKGDVSR